MNVQKTMFSIPAEITKDILKRSKVTVIKAGYTRYRKKGRIETETAKAVTAVSVTRPGTSSKLHIASSFSPFSKALILST